MKDVPGKFITDFIELHSATTKNTVTVLGPDEHWCSFADARRPK